MKNIFRLAISRLPFNIHYTMLSPLKGIQLHIANPAWLWDSQFLRYESNWDWGHPAACRIWQWVAMDDVMNARECSKGCSICCFKETSVLFHIFCWRASWVRGGCCNSNSKMKITGSLAWDLCWEVICLILSLKNQVVRIRYFLPSQGILLL